MKYERAEFLKPFCTQKVYECWLRRRTAAHVKRDSKKPTKKIKPECYRRAIHQAVKDSGGVDAYTKETLDWTLLSKYRNSEAKKKGSLYKKTFALLPSVDHDRDPNGGFVFRICSWRTNDSKSDLTLAEFKELCRLVLQNT